MPRFDPLLCQGRPLTRLRAGSGKLGRPPMARRSTESWRGAPRWRSRACSARFSSRSRSPSRRSSGWSTAADRASRTPLGRDQGIFQYVGWALRQGQVDYRDVRDVNGPLTHLVHVAFLALGGADDHRFRVLDLVVTGATFAFAGACLPGLRSPRARSRDWAGRAAWALAGWVVLSGQYLLFGYWDLAQRESFFDWFMLPSVALQLVAQAPRASAGAARRARRRRDCWRGAARSASFPGSASRPSRSSRSPSSSPSLADDELVLPRKKALRAFALGGALERGHPLGLLVAYGDALAFVRIQVVDVPALYRFIWPRAAADIFSNPWCATQAIFAIAGARRPPLARRARRDAARGDRRRRSCPCARSRASSCRPRGSRTTFTRSRRACTSNGWPSPPGSPRGRASRAGRWALVRLAPIAVGLVLAFRVATAHGRLAARACDVAALERRATPAAAIDARVLRALSRDRLLPVRDAAGRGVPARAHASRTTACRSTGWTRTCSFWRSA